MTKILSDKFFLQIAAIIFIAGGGWFKLNSIEEKVDLKMNELKAYINGDNKAGEIRISRLESDNTRHENQIIVMGTTLAILQKEIEVPKSK